MHYVLVYLSDGDHHCGSPLNSAILDKLRMDIDKYSIKLSVIVAGIINPDTGLGMMIKTKLETVNMPYLESVYYARTNSDLKPVLENIQEGFIRSLDNYTILQLRLDNGVFINENLSSETSCIMSGSNKSYFAVKNINNKQSDIYVNNILIENIPVKQLQYDDIINVIDAITPN